MNRSKSGTQERIVEAAAQLFSKKGFSGTSTRALARLADVNETSLYRYFPHKQDLFWAALQSRLERLRVSKDLRKGLLNGGNPEEVLPHLVEFLVNVGANQPELPKLLEVAFLELRSGAERLFRHYLTPIYDMIRDYLAHCMKNGTLHAMDPSIATIAFVSSIFVHQGVQSLFTDTQVPFSTTEDTVSTYSHFWLNILMAPINKLSATRANLSPRAVG